MGVGTCTLRCIYIIWTLVLGWDLDDLTSCYYVFLTQYLQLYMNNISGPMENENIARGLTSDPLILLLHNTPISIVRIYS